MQISVFTTRACAQCESTKRLMTKLGIRFDEMALEQHPEQLEAFKEAGHLQAPIVLADGQVWSGFRYEKIQSLARKLFGENRDS